MFWELYQYYTTPASPVAKKMGFLEEAISMAARRKRCRTQWDSHFKHCQNAILQAVSQAELHRKIVIFGAGSLLDIPLSQLSQQFEKVYLVDIIFLKAARQAIKAYPNVYLVEQDVTGVLEGVLQGQSSQNMLSTVCYAPLKNATWGSLDEIDCVVSLNLLSQIPLLPVNWLLKKTAISEKQAEIFGQHLIQSHLDYLNQFKQIKCLISDRNHIEFNQAHQVTDEFNPLWEVEVPKPSEEWMWEVMPLGESESKTGQRNQVGVSIW